MKRLLISLALTAPLAASAQEVGEEQLTLLSPPDGLVTTTYRMEAFECSVGKNLDYHVQLGFYTRTAAEDSEEATEVWIRGISEAFPDSWVKGDLVPPSKGYDAERLIIDMDQYLGIYNLSGTDYNIWLTGINHDMARFEEPQFTYNPRTGIFTQIDGNWLVVNGSLTEWRWLNNMSDIMLSPVTDEEELTDHYVPVQPPTDPATQAPVPTTTFTVGGTDYSFGSPEALAEYSVELAVSTADSAPGEATIFVRGLFADMPEAWIKGKVATSPEGVPVRLTFASPQYLGKWYDSIDCWFMGSNASEETTSVSFDYDATLEAYVQQEDVRIYFNDDFAAPSPMALQVIGGMTLKGDPLVIPDGLHRLTASPDQTPPGYDLSGRRTDADARHKVVIVNHRKVMR